MGLNACLRQLTNTDIRAAAEPDCRVSRKFRKNWGPRMYQYDQYDQTIVDERVAQYSDQVRRRLSGELSEEEFRPLRRHPSEAGG